MRGDTTTSELEADGGAAAGIAERRPSIVTLQSMLKKVSQSPFHNKYQALVSSSSDSSANDSGNKQVGELFSDPSAAATDATDDWLHTRQNGEQELHHFSPQNGVQSGLERMNPFYKYYLESGNKGHEMEDVEGKTSEVNLETIFVPPPEFQSSPLDGQTEIETLENGVELSESEKDIFQAFISKHPQRSLPTSTFAHNASTNGFFHDDTGNTPDLLKTLPTHTQTSKTTQLKSSDLFKNEQVDPFQASEGKDLLHAEHTTDGKPFATFPSVCEDPFTSPLKWEDDLFQAPQSAVENPFVTKNEANQVQAGPTKSEELFSFWEPKQDPGTKEDLFGKTSLTEDLDVFSPSSTGAIDPFPSPITRNLFEDLSSVGDPFGDTPSKQHNPFQNVPNGTPDIFQPLPPKINSKDVVDVFPSSTASKLTYTAPSLSSPSTEMKLDMDTSPDLFKEMPQESHPTIQPKSLDQPSDIVLTTPQGTKHGILQPTPFTRAMNLPMSPSQSSSQPEMDHVQIFKRPPRPLPRTRPPVKQKPPLPPEKPPKPQKPSTPAKDIEPESTAPQVFPKPAIRPFLKPVIRRKPKAPEVSPENYVVFEDILLLGQEKCVEDWPEDSPELQPGFKPSGTLKLRRESLKLKADSDGGSGDDQDATESQGKKKDKKFKMSFMSRRGSKTVQDKFTDDTKEARSRTLPSPRKSTKEYIPDMHTSAGESENDTDYKKKPLKVKVNQLLRRASTTSSMTEATQSSRAKQDDGLNKKGITKKDSVRRWSEGTVLHNSTGEEDEGGEAQHEETDANGTKSKKKVKIKFVPHRGFAITVEKTDDELKGAHGYTPRKGSKDKLQEEVLGAHGFTPRKKSQDDAFEDVEEIKAQRLQSTSKAAFMDDDDFCQADRDLCEMADCKPKKPTKMKMLHTGRRSSKEDMLDDPSLQKKKSSFSADELDEEYLYGMEDCKPKQNRHKGPKLMPRKSRANSRHSEASGFSHGPPHQASDDACAEDDICQTGEMYDYQQDEPETCKPKKTSKLKAFKKHLSQKKAMGLEYEDPPGATSGDYLSEAAKAEWLAAQMDERALAGLEDEDEDGDTDSLMEWWNTVEQWDEVPSDDEDKTIKEEASKSFTILADKVHRGLRVFNKVFTERAEVLWQSVITLHALADDINNFHQKAKIAGITGGTTTAVGGVTAIAGLALAPFTLGASLVITAVGVGVATAGGITSASAAISDNVNNMHDRKKVEVVLEEYEDHLLDIGKILHFVNYGLNKLRGHPFLRSGTQHYSEDWEIRRAVQMISLVDSPIMRAVDIADTALASVQGLFKGIDKYFIKDSRELKKGCKKEMVAQIKEVATVLNDGVVELNAIREELQDATGNI